MTTNHPRAHNAASARILRRTDFEAESTLEPMTYAEEHTPSGATTRSGVFVPAHMLRPGASVEEAAARARELGVVTHEEEHHAFAPARDELMDHEYDGIREYDNPTPGWWYLILHGSIVFSILYVAIYHSSIVPTLHERYAASEARALEVRFAELRKVPDGEPKIRAIMAQPAWLAQGEAVFQSSCVLCHGQQAEGLVGPNLTDEYFKNATTLTGMYDVILSGAANGAMPPKGGAPLNIEEVALVTAYVASLRGKNLEGPRGPEGEQIPPFPEPAEYNPSEG